MNNLKPFFCFMMGVSITLNGVLLIDYIKKTETMKDMEACSDKDMERQARRFLERHRENDTDYVSKFRRMMSNTQERWG